ncbi:MAG: GxxExxY protein [Burkholderiales bacterium]|nr:GxxExxY protein [Burkholderiales bacterium]
MNGFNAERAENAEDRGVDFNEISARIIGAAVEAHAQPGPGLLESIYDEALALELESRSLAVSRQVEVPLIYKGAPLRHRLRLDLLVADTVIVEVKSVETLPRIHEAQLLRYLLLADKRPGLLINFNVPKLLGGVHRIVNRL